MNKLSTLLRETSVARFFIPGGLILLIAGIVFLVVTVNTQNYISVESEITEVIEKEEQVTDDDGTRMETKYDAKVKYIIDGKEYTTELVDVSNHEIGNKITIYYNPKNPSEITQSKSILFPIIFIAIGGIFIAIGVVDLVRAIKNYKKMKEQEKGWAKNNG